jgi:hypothetical protein
VSAKWGKHDHAVMVVDQGPIAPALNPPKNEGLWLSNQS